MFSLIFKTLWARRRRNGWLLAELILVCVLSWIMFDPVVTLTYDRHYPMGYEPDRLCMVSLNVLKPQAPGYDPAASDSASLMEAYTSLMLRARQHPDVERATMVFGFSYLSSMGSMSNVLRVEGDTVTNGVQVFQLPYMPHTDYFETYGLTPVAGSPDQTRLSDYAGDGMILSENALTALFHSADPRGKRLWNYYQADTTRFEVAGAVGTVKFRSYNRPTPLCFRPVRKVDIEEYFPDHANVLVRLREGVSMARFLHDFKPWMLQNLRAGNLYARDLQSYPQLIADGEFYLVNSVYWRNLLMAAFFLVNLCLGVAGTFWLQTRTRREEIGVMLSFGATPGRIVRLLLGEGAALATLATVTGCLLYLPYALMEGLSRNGADWLKVDPCWLDSFPLHFLGVSLVVYALLLAVVSVGVWIPASRISRIAPTDALRDE